MNMSNASDEHQIAQPAMVPECEHGYGVRGNCVECLRTEVKRLKKALELACTPPYKQGGIPGRRDEGLERFFLRRAAEAEKEVSG